MATPQAPSRPADNWAPIILGAVLGLIFSGLITAGVTGWQVYRRSNTAQETIVAPATLSAQPAASTGGSASYPFYTPSTQSGNAGAPATLKAYTNPSNAASPGAYSAPSGYSSPQATPYPTPSPGYSSGDSAPASVTYPDPQPEPSPDGSEPQPVSPGGPT